MLELHIKKSFKKDIKKLKNSNIKEKTRKIIDSIITKILNEEPLNRKYQNHSLKGNWKNCYDCHVLPDLVLIYQIDKNNNKLILVRIGSHSELF